MRRKAIYYDSKSNYLVWYLLYVAQVLYSFAHLNKSCMTFYVCVVDCLKSIKMKFSKIKTNRSIIYTIIAFLVGFIYLMYAEPKPIESIAHIGLLVATALGYMLASFLFGTIVLLILMLFFKRIKTDFWNFSTLMMVGGVKLLVLSNLFV